jgi:peptidase YpeB-like protein
MKTRFVLLAALAATVALAAAAFAFGGGSGLIFDDGHYVKPGSLDDGKQYLPQTTISLAQAVAFAQRAADGQLGQVDLESHGGRVVYVVDVGAREVNVDAGDGSVTGIGPQS